MNNLTNMSLYQLFKMRIDRDIKKGVTDFSHVTERMNKMLAIDELTIDEFEELMSMIPVVTE